MEPEPMHTTPSYEAENVRFDVKALLGPFQRLVVFVVQFVTAALLFEEFPIQVKRHANLYLPRRTHIHHLRVTFELLD
jgi:hypothetical protein